MDASGDHQRVTNCCGSTAPGGMTEIHVWCLKCLPIICFSKNWLFFIWNRFYSLIVNLLSILQISHWLHLRIEEVWTCRINYDLIAAAVLKPMISMFKINYICYTNWSISVPCHCDICFGPILLRISSSQQSYLLKSMLSKQETFSHCWVLKIYFTPDIHNYVFLFTPNTFHRLSTRNSRQYTRL